MDHRREMCFFDSCVPDFVVVHAYLTKRRSKCGLFSVWNNTHRLRDKLWTDRLNVSWDERRDNASVVNKFLCFRSFKHCLLLSHPKDWRCVIPSFSEWECEDFEKKDREAIIMRRKRKRRRRTCLRRYPEKKHLPLLPSSVFARDSHQVRVHSNGQTLRTRQGSISNLGIPFFDLFSPRCCVSRWDWQSNSEANRMQSLPLE